jgi:hypothetical protein
MNFVRGIDPKRSMKIGIVTWKNLSDGCSLRTKRWVPFTSYKDGSFRFTSDRAKQDSHILALETIHIKNIERKKYTIRIKYNYNGFENRYILEGSIERFQKYFDIVQENGL